LVKNRNEVENLTRIVAALPNDPPQMNKKEEALEDNSRDRLRRTKSKKESDNEENEE
jgi:hypothetical protein